MPNDSPTYLLIKPGDPPPPLSNAGYFRAIVVIERESKSDWQTQIGDWLVHGGCRFMMAWGQQCEELHDRVDEANLRMYDWKEIPEQDFVFTTWHEDEPLQHVFWFAEHCASHPSLLLEKLYLIHIAEEPRAAELLNAFQEAQLSVE